MGILAYGLNYRTASLDLRERVAFPEDSIGAALRQIKHDVSGLSEAAIISTCNRTELYCAIEAGAEPNLHRWLADHRPVTPSELTDTTYRHWDQDAAKHMIRVASGLDSQVLGEPQIMGQVKTAYEIAHDSGTMGPELKLLSGIIIRSAKEVRTQTEIGRNPISVAYAAVSLAQQIFENLSTKKALLIGAGETVSLVADHMIGQGIGDLTIANRTLSNAELLAAKSGAAAIQLTQVAERLADFDVVVSSTGSSLPVVGKGAVEAAIKQRKHRPMFMVDIAVPRDIEAEVAELPDVYLYTIDDLTQIVETNVQQRREAAASAETFVIEGAEEYLRERRRRQSQHLVTDFREQAHAVQSAALSRALRDLQNGADPEDVLSRFASNLTNKLIHAPTQAMRDASADGRTDLLEYLRRIYALPDANEDQEKL